MLSGFEFVFHFRCRSRQQPRAAIRMILALQETDTEHNSQASLQIFVISNSRRFDSPR